MLKLRKRIQSEELKMKIEQREEGLSKIINITQSKNERLFGQKSCLEILLGLIKKAQVEYLNSTDTNKNTMVLMDLKESLTEIAKEKDKIMDLVLNQNQQKKVKLKQLAFNTVYYKRSVSSSNYVANNLETVVTEYNEYDYSKEDRQVTPELKLLNFKAEYELMKVNFFIQKDQFLIQYYKSPHLINEHLTEIYCEDTKSIEFVNKLLHQELKEQREKFIDIVNLKNIQDIRISTMQSQSIGYKNAMKDINKSYRYVDTHEIIEEENKSYMETIKEDEKGEATPKFSNKNRNSGTFNNYTNFKRIGMNDVEKLMKLNMNINVNINYNNQYINNKCCTKKKSDIKEEDSLDHCKNEKVQEDTLK